MKHLQLQPRLRLLADMVPAGAHLADIGTDHGYVPIYLYKKGRIKKAYACDVRKGPLEKCKKNTQERYEIVKSEPAQSPVRRTFSADETAGASKNFESFMQL